MSLCPNNSFVQPFSRDWVGLLEELQVRISRRKDRKLIRFLETVVLVTRLKTESLWL